MRQEQILSVSPDRWLHLVADLPEVTKETLIFSHGLTGDRCGPQRLLSYLAEELCKKGIAVIRFDFQGSGDSSGAFEETTFEQMERDLMTVIDWSNAASLILAGLSIGGVPAVMCAQKVKCKSLFLISSDLVDRPTFSTLQDPHPVRKGHFFLNKEYYSERSRLAPREILSTLNIPSFLFYGEMDEKMGAAAQEIKGLKQSYCFHQTDHLFESLSVREELLKKIIESI